MTTQQAIALLDQFRAGAISRAKVLHAFQSPSIADLGYAQVDLQRSLRKNFPEVIFGEGKTPPQVVAIASEIVRRDGRVLVTRIGPGHARALRRTHRKAVYHPLARCLTLDRSPLPKRPGAIAVVCAGTSDLPVA